MSSAWQNTQQSCTAIRLLDFSPSGFAPSNSPLAAANSSGKCSIQYKVQGVVFARLRGLCSKSCVHRMRKGEAGEVECVIWISSAARLSRADRDEELARALF